MNEKKYFLSWEERKMDARGRIIYLLSNSKRWREKCRPDLTEQTVHTFTYGHAHIECLSDFLEYSMVYNEDSQSAFSVNVPYSQLYEVEDYIIYMPEKDRRVTLSIKIGWEE